jgi:hypothetical protein
MSDCGRFPQVYPTGPFLIKKKVTKMNECRDMYAKLK